MKKIKILYFFSIISLFFACIIAGFVISRNNNRTLIALREGERLKSESLNVLMSNIQYAYKLNNSPISLDLHDLSGNKININDLSNKGNKIVLRYSELDCNVCVDSAISYFTKFSEKIGKNKAIILVESRSPNYISDLIRLNRIRLPTYQIMNKHPEGIVATSPFLFVLDRDNLMKDVFYPMKELPALSGIYYNTLYKKYFSK